MRLSVIFGLEVDEDIEKPENDICDVSFADDCVFAVFKTARLLVEEVSKAMSIISEAFSFFCLELNLNKGKTAVLMYFRGPGANKA